MLDAEISCEQIQNEKLMEEHITFFDRQFILGVAPMLSRSVVDPGRCMHARMGMGAPA